MRRIFHGNIRPSGYVPAFLSTQPVVVREEITGGDPEGTDTDKEVTKTEENNQMLEAAS